MKRKVLLIMPKIEKYKDYHHLPFGCLALAAVLEKLNVAYDIFDERVDETSWLDSRINDYGIVGVSMFTGYQTTCGVRWLRYVREHNPDAITIAGGPHVTALPEQTARSPLVDFAVAGYAENAFGRLIEAILQEDNLDSARALIAPGIYSKNTKSASEIFGQPTPRKYSDLEWGPLPYWRIDTNKYINPDRRLVMYVTQYGCPAQCTFCATPETRKWTHKPLDIVYQDLERLDELTDFKTIWFSDATLFTLRPRAMELVEFLDRRLPGREWMADARASELIRYSDEDLQMIKKCKANLDMLVVGLESGSERIAEKVVKKGRNHLKVYAEVAERLNNAGIRLTSGVVFGFPGETVEDLKMTQSYVAKIRKIHSGFRISTTFFRPLPGTDLYDLVKDSGFVNAQSLEDWESIGEDTHYHYNELADVPWMPEAEKKEYSKAYEGFVEEHGDIMT